MLLFIRHTVSRVGNVFIIQDKILVSHTCFGGHMDVNCYASVQTLNVSDDLKWTINTCDIIFTHFQGITTSMVLEDLFCSFILYPSTHISTRPQWFLPVQMTGGRFSAKR